MRDIIAWRLASSIAVQQTGSNEHDPRDATTTT
jgi:hypothetical protein